MTTSRRAFLCSLPFVGGLFRAKRKPIADYAYRDVDYQLRRLDENRKSMIQFHERMLDDMNRNILLNDMTDFRWPSGMGNVIRKP